MRNVMTVKLSKTDMGLLARAVVATDISWASPYKKGNAKRSLEKLFKLGILTDRYMPTEFGRAVYIRMVIEEEYSTSPAERVAARLIAAGFNDDCMYRTSYGKWGVIRTASDVATNNSSNSMRDVRRGLNRVKPFDSLTLFTCDFQKEES
jgi:hypothetical protein